MVAAFTATLSGGALAFEFDTGNPDLSIRWDNTFRYNLGVRVEGRDNNIGNSAVSDEGTYSFNTGSIVTNRLDVLSELDVVYKKWIGFRLSGAGWWDAAYGADSHSNPNPPLVNIPSYPNLQYTNYTKRYYRGPSGELLDAFGFANFDLGTVPTSLKAGRLSLYWGESLFVGGNLHGIAYAQNPLDLQKGFATPGSEAKELFRPLGQVSGTAQITDTVSVAAQYFWQWEEFRYPEGGTYTGPVDFVFNGPVRQFLPQPGLGFATRGNAFEPGQSGEWGVSARWSPEWLDGTLGFYYRNFADKLPQTLLTQVGPNRSVYNLIYKDDIDLWGISLAKNIAGVSVGAELSYRHNTPLNSQVLGNASAAGTPARGTTPGPVGDTYHGLVNVVGLIPKTPVFDTAAYALELTWSQWAEVKSGQNLFNAVGYPGLHGGRPAGQQVGRLHHQELLRPGARFHADLVPGLPGRGSPGAAHVRDRAERQRPHRVRRQPGERQLDDRRRRRHLPEVPRRPEVHRLVRPLQGQRQRRHVTERPHDPALRPGLREPDPQDHLLRRKQCISRRV